MPHHAAADLAALIHRITDADAPSPADIIELRRVIAAGFVSRHPVPVLMAAQDRGIDVADFQTRWAVAISLAAGPLRPAGGGSQPGGNQRSSNDRAWGRRGRTSAKSLREFRVPEDDHLGDPEP